MILMGIHGRKRTGKDTMAGMLLDEFGGVNYKLAEPIKRSLFESRPAKFFHLTFDDIDGVGSVDRDQPMPNLTESTACIWLYEAIENCGLADNLSVGEFTETFDRLNKKYGGQWSIRRLMTTLGTDIVVNLIDRDHWNKLMMSEFINRLDDDGLFIVSDIRQDWEIKLIRSMGAPIIHVHRDTGLTADHSTEHGQAIMLNGRETLIRNDSTLDALRQKAIEFVTETTTIAK